VDPCWEGLRRGIAREPRADTSNFRRKKKPIIAGRSGRKKTGRGESKENNTSRAAAAEHRDSWGGDYTSAVKKNNGDRATPPKKAAGELDNQERSERDMVTRSSLATRTGILRRGTKNDGPGTPL